MKTKSHKVMVSVFCFLCLTGCAVDFQAPKSNYAKIGVYKDFLDQKYYNYVETGKNVPVSKNGSVNLSLGLSNVGSDRLIEIDKEINNYWELNYEYRW